jgi:hypothetical protein
MSTILVYDQQGGPIRVTDVPAAIAQCKESLAMYHTDPAYAGLDRTIHAHWRHILDQLEALPQAQTTPHTA